MTKRSPNSRKAFREELNSLDDGARPHRNGVYRQRSRKYGDYLWFQDRNKFEVDYAEWLVARNSNSEA